jgi:hypothetical protein
MRKAVWICVAVAALAAVLSAQGTTSADGTTQALVTELRALRADINRIAGASIRTQLLATRLQLQEQRILTLSRQIDDVQKELSGMGQVRAGLEMQMKQMADHAGGGPESDERDRAIEMMKQQLALQQNREYQLRQQESSLSAILADDQARWNDFSSRLDELERSLARSAR